VSTRSIVGVNGANFFVAEILGVTLPFIGDFLRERGWRYDTIGLAGAVAGLGIFVMQTPAGILVDRIAARRWLLAAAAVAFGACVGLLPLLPSTWEVVVGLLFVGGAAQAFFVPTLAALALGLVGHGAFSRMMGANQGWNHAGNLFAALSAMALVSAWGIPAVFFSVAVVSFLAAASALLVDPREVDDRRATGREGAPQVGSLFRDRRVAALFVAVLLFHLANAPTMPLVALDLVRLGGSQRQVAAVVLVSQAVMVPMAISAGWLSERWGRKPVFAVAFFTLPLRIASYSFAQEPGTLVALQALDGIGAGIYGVSIAVMSADLAQGRGHFNALMGVFATAMSLGGVLGPLGAGALVQHLGFDTAFRVIAMVAMLAAVAFVLLVPETGRVRSRP